MDREGGGGKGGVCDNLEGSLLSQWQEVIHEEAGGVKGGGRAGWARRRCTGARGLLGTLEGGEVSRGGGRNMTFLRHPAWGSEGNAGINELHLVRGRGRGSD